MHRIAAFSASLMLASLAACSSSPPAQAPEPATAGSAAEPAASAAPSAEPAAAAPAKPPPADEASPTETLARDLIKSGGRRIAYSATKKRFLVPIEQRSDGGRGLSLRFYDDEGQERDIQRVCQPGECEERLDELARELIPTLGARLAKEGYEPISAVGWPSGRDEIEIGSIGAKLRYEKGKLSALREKKPPAQLRSLGGRSPKKAALSAVYPVPGAKLLGALAEGDKTAQDFFVFKLP